MKILELQGTFRGVTGKTGKLELAKKTNYFQKNFTGTAKFDYHYERKRCVGVEQSVAAGSSTAKISE